MSDRKQPPSPPNFNRRLDILGIFMLLIGGATLLGLLSPENSRVMGSWVTFIQKLLGITYLVFPAVLIVGGGWLLARRFKSVPSLSLSTTTGVILLYALLLGCAHYLTFPETAAVSWEIAQNGKGGGYLGALILGPLQSLFGKGGTAVALAAWFLIALSLTLDQSILALFSWVPDFRDLLQKIWGEIAPKHQETAPEHASMPANGREPSPARPNIPRARQDLEIPIEEEHAPNWVLPHIPDILNIGQEVEPDEEYDRHRAEVIEETLDSFGAPGHVVEINRGPTITQFGVEPDFIETRNSKRRVRVSAITRLADDLALALAAKRIRIEAPVPGKGYVGVEVPNDEIALVALRDAIQSPAFQKLGSPLKITLGKDVSGNTVATDLSSLPHLLIAGTTGSGKSVCINALISCLLLHNTPDQLRMIMVDPKRVELTGYEGIPHLLAPVVVDLERVVGVLQWVTREMDQRYHKFSQVGARNIDDYNRKVRAQNGKKLPYLVVIIDELADLMMLAPTETEQAITRIAQLARATGIHLIISTQRPSTNVVTGLIKANFPARIAFATASGVDSRVILDQPGAETLLGRGDMLFQAPDAPAPVRLQGVFVSDDEMTRLVRYWRFLSTQIRAPKSPTAASGEPDAPLPKVPLKQMEMFEEEMQEDRDPLWDEAVELIRQRDRASISMLQRKLRIGYTRAARLIEKMAEADIIGPPKDGPKAREVIDYGEEEDPDQG
jgi:S-DNA-T family DNA segregation ATPase FtsK/SpoIIIE